MENQNNMHSNIKNNLSTNYIMDDKNNISSGWLNNAIDNTKKFIQSKPKQPKNYYNYDKKFIEDINKVAKKINNNTHSNIKNNLSTNYITTSRKSILQRNNKNERSKPVVYKRENNFTKEEVKQKLINESKKIKPIKKIY